MKILVKQRRGNLARLLLVFILIYVSEDVLLFSTNRDETLFQVKMVLLPALVVILNLWNLYQRKKYTSVSVLWTIAIAINMAFTCLVFVELDNRHLYAAVMVLLAMTVVNTLTESDFVENYRKVMRFLAVFSLVQYLIYLVAYPVTLLAPQVFNQNGLRFSNWIFTNSLNREYYQIMPYRNWGIYREPGAYVVFLVLAFIFELFFTKKPKVLDVVIYAVTIFTTFSTAGYIVAVIVAVTYIFQFRYNTQRKILWLFGAGAVVAVAFLTIYLLDLPIYHWVFAKLTREGGSAGSRIGSVLSNLALFLRSPLWGNGWLKMAEESATVQTLVVTHHNTNTLLIFFAVYGIIGGIAMGWGSICFFARQRRGFAGLLLALCWILALSNENMTLNVTVYLIALYGWMKPKLPKRGEKTNEAEGSPGESH